MAEELLRDTQKDLLKINSNSMRIQLQQAGKRFNRDWIFRNFTADFNSGNSYAITGPNGSGKSTLLQTISGSLGISEGSIEWEKENKRIEPENIYAEISIVAPYLEVVEEMTPVEFLEFHFSFKPKKSNISIQEIIEEVELDKAAQKQIRFFSSGMKQRIKLAQAIFSESSILLLDEPCTNFDVQGFKLYQNLISKYCSSKIIIVSSNDENEYAFCKNIINIMNYK